MLAVLIDRNGEILSYFGHYESTHPMWTSFEHGANAFVGFMAAGTARRKCQAWTTTKSIARLAWLQHGGLNGYSLYFVTEPETIGSVLHSVHATMVDECSGSIGALLDLPHASKPFKCGKSALAHRIGHNIRQAALECTV